ncbi:hypothetical protein [Chryseobacterium hagamense]|uniref:Uncharacterized protein n=1 Tax=Chryseobacterium hagamense TaxID=395935 RepID=A0A511YHY2_9FLAO|nr:hypothetical protein [Chryseobacterium hagamense]GEN74783.1 hypothetical protein CHA01nite_05230 [Chryseobacterium hagamense]
MENNPITDYFNTICEFRQVHPVVKGAPLRTNDPGMMTIRDALNGFKECLQNKYREFQGTDLSVEISRGIINLPHVLYACILPPGQLVPNGIYTVICFDVSGRGALVGCVESKVTSKGLNTVQRKKGPGLLPIDVDGASDRTKYNNVFVNPKEFYYPLENGEMLEQHIEESLELASFLLTL